MSRKILHVLPTFSAVGGVQARFLQLLPLLGSDLEHAVIAADGNYSGLPASYETIVKKIDLPLKRGSLWGNIGRFKMAFKVFEPDLLFSYNFGSIDAVMANVFTRAPHIHVEDGFGQDEVSGRKVRRNLARAALFRLCDSDLIVPSKTLETIALGEWRVRKESIHLIPNGINIVRYQRKVQPEDARAEAGPQNLVIGTAARLRPEKRLDRLLSAFSLALKEVPNLTLMIAGDGPEMPRLRAQVENLGIASRVKFFGHINNLGRWYGMLDIFAMSSDTEQMPISLIEAMAAALPFVVTNVGDTINMIPASSTPYVVERDELAIANKLIFLTRSAQLRHDLGRQNLLHVESRYSEDQMVRAWRHLVDIKLRIPGHREDQKN